MRLVNLTNAQVNLQSATGQKKKIYRIKSEGHAWVGRQMPGRLPQVVGLPAEETDTIYIVDPHVLNVAQQSTGRQDVVALDLSDVTTDKKGKVVVRGFIR